MNAVSTNYRELQPHEIQSVADECAQAWTDPSIPARQYQIVQPELETARRECVNGWCAPFRALVDCLYRIPGEFFDATPRLLDIGASTGYYREVLRIAGYPVRYTACDFSRAFERFAQEKFPGIDFDVADACNLPYHDDTFDVVLSGAALMHIREYEQAIREAVRVSSRYVIFHRTPVCTHCPNRWFVKEAYGIRVLEVHFNEGALLELFHSVGLRLIHTAEVFWDVMESQGHKTYLLEKPAGLSHVQV